MRDRIKGLEKRVEELGKTGKGGVEEMDLNESKGGGREIARARKE